MSDTKHHHAPTPDPVESDGVAYRGIGWFLVILVLTVAASQLVVWGAFEFFEWRVSRSEAPRAVMAGPVATPSLEGGRVATGAEGVTAPALLVEEPTVLRDFNARQHEMQATYGWIDQAMGTVRLPIDRAKDLVLERGLPVRPAPAAAVPAAAPAQPSAAAAQVAAPAGAAH
jgi:hypothetical protein